MPEKANIPVNVMLDNPEIGISIERLSLTDTSLSNNTEETDRFEEGGHSHRHDSHSFYLLEKGTLSIEIDFQTYAINAPSIVYIHPTQVHRTTAFDAVTVSSLAISNENLNRDYLTLLEDMTPAHPLTPEEEVLSLLSQSLSLCFKCSERKRNTLYHSLLKDSCNVVAGLFISQYLSEAKPAVHTPRFETVAKAFHKLLESNYTTLKRPAEYAQQLNLSVAYLNECVKHTTGHSVSYHIQQRVVLEAKRLLYHSGRSAKETAAALGYDDYPYFSRLFTKATGMSPIAFQNKNRG